MKNTRKYYVLEHSLNWFPDEEVYPLAHLDMEKLLNWSNVYRAHWQKHGPAPSTWEWKNYPLLRVLIKSSQPVPDHFSCGSQMIISSRLHELLAQECGQKEVEFHKVKIIGGQTNGQNHYIYNVLAVDNPVDLSQSEIDYFEDEECGRMAEGIHRLVLSEHELISNQIFVIDFFPIQIVVISAGLKEKIQQLGFTGCVFIPLEEYHSLWMTKDWES
jgi:hypothetical protein